MWPENRWAGGSLGSTAAGNLDSGFPYGTSVRDFRTGLGYGTWIRDFRTGLPRLILGEILTGLSARHADQYGDGRHSVRGSVRVRFFSSLRSRPGWCERGRPSGDLVVSADPPIPVIPGSFAACSGPAVSAMRRPGSRSPAAPSRRDRWPAHRYGRPRAHSRSARWPATRPG